MKYEQIAGVLNSTIMTAMTGEAAVANEDLSNIVDVGKVVLDYTALGVNNFNDFISGLIDQVGKVVFWDRVYRSLAPKIERESFEYGSVLMKTRVTAPDFRDNVSHGTSSLSGLGGIWADAQTNSRAANISNYPQLDPFEIVLPEAEAKFYNSAITFECPITIAEKQLKTAFRSAQEMSAFIATIENRIQMKKTIATDALIYRTIANFMGLKILGGQYIDLAATYATETGETAPATYALAKNDGDFLRWAVAKIDVMRSYMAEASVLFNDAGYLTFTPREKSKLIILKDFDSALKSNLYSSTYHDEFVKLDGYEIVNDWQGTGTTINSGDRSTLNVKVGKVFGEDEEDTVSATVVATLFDIDGCCVCNEDPRTTSQYNGRGEYTNFFYKWDARYLNDDVENGLVFVYGEPTIGDDSDNNVDEPVGGES